MSPPTVLAIFTTSFIVGLSGAVTPGPLLAYSVQEAVRLGFPAGPLVASGHAALELAVVVGLALGVGRFLQHSLIFGLIGLVGGGVLLWLAWGMLRHPPPGYQATGVVARGPFSARGPLLGGVLVSLSNPYWVIWWITIGLFYLAWSQPLGPLGLGSFYLGHILADYGWYSLVALAVASGRRLVGPRVYQGVVRGCGLVLAGLGALFLFRGVEALLAL